MKLSVSENQVLTVNIKLSGTFVEKPLMFKKAGVFEQVSGIQTGGWA